MFRQIYISHPQWWAFLVVLVVKKPHATAADIRDADSIPGSGRSPGGEQPTLETHSSILAWRIPWTEKPGRLQSMRSPTVGHNWSNSAHTHTHTSSLMLCHNHYHERRVSDLCPLICCRASLPCCHFLRRRYSKLQIGSEWHFRDSPSSSIISSSFLIWMCCYRSGLDNPAFSSAQSCLTLCDPMDCSTPSLPVHHQLV